MTLSIEKLCWPNRNECISRFWIYNSWISDTKSIYFNCHTEWRATRNTFISIRPTEFFNRYCHWWMRESLTTKVIQTWVMSYTEWNWALIERDDVHFSHLAFRTLKVTSFTEILLLPGSSFFTNSLMDKLNVIKRRYITSIENSSGKHLASWPWTIKLASMQVLFARQLL